MNINLKNFPHNIMSSVEPVANWPVSEMLIKVLGARFWVLVLLRLEGLTA